MGVSLKGANSGLALVTSGLEGLETIIGELMPSHYTASGVPDRLPEITSYDQHTSTVEYLNALRIRLEEDYSKIASRINWLTDFAEGIILENPIISFLDTFENPNNDLATRWVNYTGSGDLSIQTGGLTGGKVLRVGDNSGNDMAWLIYYKSIPFDPNKLYKVQLRVKRTAGSGTVYAGVAGRDSTDSAWVNIDGNDYTSGQHYICAADAAPAADWTIYTGYIKGTAATGDSTAHSDPADPGKLHTNVKYFRPMLVLNYNGAAGTMEVDAFSVEIMSTAAEGISGQGDLATLDTVGTTQIDADAVTQTVFSSTDTSISLIPSPWSTGGHGKACVVKTSDSFTSVGGPVYIDMKGNFSSSVTANTLHRIELYFRQSDAASANIAAMTLSGTDPVAIETSTGHGLTTGDYVWVEGMSGGEVNGGIFRVTVSDTTNFTLDDTRSDWFIAATGGTIKKVSVIDNSEFMVMANQTKALFGMSYLYESFTSGKDYQILGTIRNLSSSESGTHGNSVLMAMEIKR